MNQNSKSFFREIYQDQRGQMIPILAFMMISLLGCAGLVVDAGHAYFSYRLLQNSTNAAALAGAQGLPSNTTSANQALINAKAYSSRAVSKSQSAGYNAYSNLNITNATYTLGCVNGASGTPGAIGASIPCISTGVGTNTANAIQVKQTATISTTFMRLFGFSSITMSATGTALMRGSANAPYNVAIIVDTTGSMTGNTDSNCHATRLQCALNGVKTFLQDLSPCAASGCGGNASNQNYPNSLDRIALFSFPNFTTTTAAKQYDCSSSSPTSYSYTFPAIGASSMTTMPFTSGGTTYRMTYQTTYGIGDANGFVSDYRASNAATTLSSSSDIVMASGGKSGCTGMDGPGSEGTYYAGVIYAAQAALTAEATAHPGSQNVMILVSDGAATACGGNYNGCGTSQMASGTQSTTIATNSGTYPSYKNECQQAVTAAQYATSQKTTVYAVAYGAQSSGCTTDTGSYASPCYTMSKIASSAATFYSDDNVSGIYSNCPAGKSVSSLNTIFNQIAGNLTVARLIPNSAFPSS